MSGGWGRTEDPDAAVERILEGADKAFVELGVEKAGMAEVARFAGCSRGTLYRYFGTRHAMHTAYVRRKARQIHQRLETSLGRFDDPRARLVEYVLGAVRAVREDPAAAAWFVPGVSGTAARFAHAIDPIEAFAAGLAPEDAEPSGEASLRLRWLVRIIVSLLADPEPNPADERALVERFAVPAFPGEA